ncbi:PTS sugar transporter subunit IIA [Candidatus Latescibacterota bacterium]
MDIFGMVKEKSCSTSLKASDKEECIKKLSALAAKSIKEISEDTIYNAVIERENTVSTGLENGIAIPHARIEGLTDFMIGIAVSKKGIDFKSIDGKKTYIFFILLGPADNAEGHLKIMAQIMRVAKNRNAYREMLAAPNGLVLKEAFLLHARGEESVVKEPIRGKEKFLIIVLYENKYFEDIINIFVERGIKGAAVFDVRGMRNILSGIPLFSDFIDFLKERSDAGQTIMTVIDEREIATLVEEIEEIMGDLDTHSGAMILALDISYSKGSLEVL